MATIDSPEALAASAQAGGDLPANLSKPLQALWLTKADRWDEAHALAQDLHSKTGDWIHALLHLIEGDLGNSAYWYHRVGRPRPDVAQIDEEWQRIAQAVLDAESTEPEGKTRS